MNGANGGGLDHTNLKKKKYATDCHHDYLYVDNRKAFRSIKLYIVSIAIITRRFSCSIDNN